MIRQNPVSGITKLLNYTEVNLPVQKNIDYFKQDQFQSAAVIRENRERSRLLNPKSSLKQRNAIRNFHDKQFAKGGTLDFCRQLKVSEPLRFRGVGHRIPENDFWVCRIMEAQSYQDLENIVNDPKINRNDIVEAVIQLQNIWNAQQRSKNLILSEAEFERIKGFRDELIILILPPN